MPGNTIGRTMAPAPANYRCGQFTEADGGKVPVFAIFGRGNVTCLAQAPEVMQ